MLSGLKRKLKLTLHALQYKNLRYFKKYRAKLGISVSQFFELKKYSSFYKVRKQITFLKRPLEITSPFWFLHSLNEIFVEEVYLFKSAVNNPVIIDCGANIGLSVLYFKQLYPDAIITAFEADPNIYNTILKNVEAFNCQSTTVINAAVWHQNSFISFASEGTVGGKIETSKVSRATIEVPSIRLREYLQSDVDFLKIDIEGAEYEVLKDCKDLLGNVKNLFIEYHVMPGEEQHLHEILLWVNSAGFTYYIREAWNNMNYPYMKDLRDTFQMQLNIFCYK